MLDKCLVEKLNDIAEESADCPKVRPIRSRDLTAAKSMDYAATFSSRLDLASSVARYLR